MQIEGNLQLDNENFLMSTLNMIEQFVARRSIIESILQEHIEFPMKNGLELLESEWELLQDVINVLEPFKVPSSRKFSFSHHVTHLIFRMTDVFR